MYFAISKMASLITTYQYSQCLEVNAQKYRNFKECLGTKRSFHVLISPHQMVRTKLSSSICFEYILEKAKYFEIWLNKDKSFDAQNIN
jgi:hypothetical protein